MPHYPELRFRTGEESSNQGSVLKENMVQLDRDTGKAVTAGQCDTRTK